MTSSTCLTPQMFAGKSVFVTGGSSGINLAIARSFAEHGAAVAICARDADKLRSAIAELSQAGDGQALGFVADVRNDGAVRAALESAAHQHGPADVVVCGAAGNFMVRAEDLTPNGFRTVVDIDLIGTFNAANGAFEQLRATRGSLLFVSAGQAFVPFSHQAHAGAAKAGVENLMRNLALEWGRYGIRCNSIVPGPIAGTEGVRRLAADVGEEAWADMVPLGRFGTTDEIASMALVLCSPLASFVTGTTLVADGGLALTGSGRFNQALERACS
ncbi:SDR family oxidoreductase [Mycolicibacterium vulneris]|uniref:Short-chain dehydrogenase n=1 Tax=Mycolicibacterium vulneris TaxID=547163 RepID=A0A1X2KIN8_9MYCO|nr:SDR family oxidoreductase [Mycolicibacterium vulneris]OSC21196.1 short-chain dehydrogenase [Mycolicibacterium vulneris]